MRQDHADGHSHGGEEGHDSKGLAVSLPVEYVHLLLGGPVADHVVPEQVAERQITHQGPVRLQEYHLCRVNHHRRPNQREQVDKERPYREIRRNPSLIAQYITQRRRVISAFRVGIQSEPEA